MTEKFLYLIEYFVPVPFSEGGLLSVIAESDEECFDIVTEWDGENWSQYYSKLRENILKAPRFALSYEEDSRVVAEFTT